MEYSKFHGHTLQDEINTEKKTISKNYRITRAAYIYFDEKSLKGYIPNTIK